jgi:hypothetical protein
MGITGYVKKTSIYGWRYREAVLPLLYLIAEMEEQSKNCSRFRAPSAAITQKK